MHITRDIFCSKIAADLLKRRTKFGENLVIRCGLIHVGYRCKPTRSSLEHAPTQLSAYLSADALFSLRCLDAVTPGVAS
jgi:hypothetical protein